MRYDDERTRLVDEAILRELMAGADLAGARARRQYLAMWRKPDVLSDDAGTFDSDDGPDPDVPIPLTPVEPPPTPPKRPVLPTTAAPDEDTADELPADEPAPAAKVKKARAPRAARSAEDHTGLHAAILKQLEAAGAEGVKTVDVVNGQRIPSKAALAALKAMVAAGTVECTGRAAGTRWHASRVALVPAESEHAAELKMPRPVRCRSGREASDGCQCGTPCAPRQVTWRQ